MLLLEVGIVEINQGQEKKAGIGRRGVVYEYDSEK